MTLSQFDVVRVPFPFTGQASAKNRPAVVLSQAQSFNTRTGHSVMAMITTASNKGWPLDHTIDDLAAAGLRSPSVIRCKLFTLDHRLVRGVLDKLGKKTSLACARCCVLCWMFDPVCRNSIA